MEHFRELVQNYGHIIYLICFGWAFIEGETFMIFAGLLASQDILHLQYLIPAAALGTTCGDFLFFCLGRRYGMRMIGKSAKLQKGREKIATWLVKHDTVFILTYRFIYGLRNISAIVIGMSTISWQRYLWLNFLASWIWAVSFAGAGYLFGDMFVQEGQDPLLSFTIALAVLFGVILAIRYFHRWKQSRQMED